MWQYKCGKYVCLVQGSCGCVRVFVLTTIHHSRFWKVIPKLLSLASKFQLFVRNPKSETSEILLESSRGRQLLLVSNVLVSALNLIVGVPKNPCFTTRSAYLSRKNIHEQPRSIYHDSGIYARSDDVNHPTRTVHSRAKSGLTSWLKERERDFTEYKRVIFCGSPYLLLLQY